MKILISVSILFDHGVFSFGLACYEVHYMRAQEKDSLLVYLREVMTKLP